MSRASTHIVATGLVKSVMTSSNHNISVEGLQDSGQLELKGHLTGDRPSVCLSVTRVDQSKTVEVRIMQLSPQSSPMTGFLMVNFTAKFQREHRERGRQIREG